MGRADERVSLPGERPTIRRPILGRAQASVGFQRAGWPTPPDGTSGVVIVATQVSKHRTRRLQYAAQLPFGRY
jgi:hypothetical protein